jgi:hypothetical protein
MMATTDPSTMETLLEANLIQLAQDPYGNYAIQDAIKQRFLPESLYPILVDNMVVLSAQKFSSNVVERVMEQMPHLVLPRLLEEMTVIGLINSHFGFFVAKKAI